MTDQTSDDGLLSSLGDLPGVSTTGWRKVGGTSAGGYFEAAPGVLVAVPVSGYVQVAEDAHRSLAEFHRIVDERGRAHAAIVLVDRVKSQDAAARRVWSDAKDTDRRCALALVCASPLARAIGSFFIGFNRPQVPTKMFRDFPGALAWSKEMVAASWEGREAGV